MPSARSLAIAAIVTGAPALAAPVPPTDLDNLTLGAFVVGPVGTTVDSSFLAADGADLGDFSGGAACPDGFATCDPMSVDAGTVFTFVQTIVPGADTVENDPPLASDGPLTSPGAVTSYGFTRAIPGFTGTAGYSFSDAAQFGLSFDIDVAGDNGPLTFTSTGADWTDGQAVRFFFQTTQPPMGPGQAYAFDGTSASGVATGPVPAPIPMPASLPLLLAGLGALGLWRRR